MLKILYFLILDVAFICALVSWWDEMGHYIFIPIIFIALFTYGIIYAIRERFG